jgi:serine/threonine protein kinase
MDKYTLEERIGEGSYAIVYRARKGGKLYAIKALKDDFDRLEATANSILLHIYNAALILQLCNC